MTGEVYNADADLVDLLRVREQRLFGKVLPLIFRNDGGDDELGTSVYPSHTAPIGAKLRQRAFRKICNFRFLDAEIFVSAKQTKSPKFWDQKVRFS